MYKNQFSNVENTVHPTVLLFTGFLTGVTLGFVLMPKIISYEISSGNDFVNWETLLAGFLGLVGGSFAFFAVIHQSRKEQAQRRLAYRIRLSKIVGKIQLRADNFIEPHLSSPMFDGFYDYDRSDQTSLNYVKEALEELPEYVPDDIVTEKLSEAHMGLKSLLKSYDYLFSQRHSIQKRNLERAFLDISKKSKEYLDQLKH